MKTLYLDNYKGFVKTFIPCLDVNFFVGENSTGKTAILNLLNIILLLELNSKKRKAKMLPNIFG